MDRRNLQPFLLVCLHVRFRLRRKCLRCQPLRKRGCGLQIRHPRCSIRVGPLKKILLPNDLRLGNCWVIGLGKALGKTTILFSFPERSPGSLFLRRSENQVWQLVPRCLRRA